MAHTTLTVGDPPQGDVILAPNVHELVRITGIMVNDLGQHVFACEVWDDSIQGYVARPPVTLTDGDDSA